MSPAAESTTTASASCAATSDSVVRRERRLAVSRTPDRSIRTSATRDVSTAGAIANTTSASAVIDTAPRSAVELT
jgi:hypothetical protein